MCEIYLITRFVSKERTIIRVGYFSWRPHCIRTGRYIAGLKKAKEKNTLRLHLDLLWYEALSLRHPTQHRHVIPRAQWALPINRRSQEKVFETRQGLCTQNHRYILFSLIEGLTTPSWNCSSLLEGTNWPIRNSPLKFARGDGALSRWCEEQEEEAATRQRSRV